MSRSSKAPSAEAWPSDREYTARLRVPDLVPERASLKVIFIGESPHRDEVAPEALDDRTPFRGVAGREWWTEVSRFLKKPLQARPKVPGRRELTEACAELGFALLNAVQFPIDPKITLHQGDDSGPYAKLGFEKATGTTGYKAVYKASGDAGPVGIAIRNLARRLAELGEHPAQVVCLGNDSRWFVERALLLLPETSSLRRKPLLTVPHPSSWWRNASYKARAVDFLDGSLA